MPTQRRATQPQRRFTPEALAALDRDACRKLVQVLLTETGSRVVGCGQVCCNGRFERDQLALDVDALRKRSHSRRSVWSLIVA